MCGLLVSQKTKINRHDKRNGQSPLKTNEK